MASANKPKYTYTRLFDLRKNSKVNIFGVVKFLKQPYRSRGSDYCMLVSLVDDSLQHIEDSIKCLLFAKDEDKLPVTALGNIVCFHRLQVGEFHGSLQGQSSPGFSWMIFSGDRNASLDPIQASSVNFNITEEDKERVSQLRDWVSGKHELVEKLSTFHQIGAGCYFNLVCQVVSICMVEKDVCLLLRVWDGTKTIYKVKSAEKELDSQAMSTDLGLQERAESLVYDVFVYDNHVKAAEKVKPGAFIKLINLHAAECKAKDMVDPQSGLPTVELVLHRGDSFGRGVRLLSSDNSDVKSLRKRLDKFTLPNLSSDFEVSERVMDLTVETDVELEIDLNGNQAQNAVADEENQTKTTQRPNTDRCMLQTKTVILYHPHIQQSSIADVIEHQGPGKFRICAQVLAFHPGSSPTENLMKLYCSACHYLCEVPHKTTSGSGCPSELKIVNNAQGMSRFLCPECQNDTDKLAEPERMPQLNYTYMLRLLLHDGTGMLLANIWGPEATSFFKGIEPDEAAESDSVLAQVRRLLQEICPSGVTTDSKPWVECCLRSYCVNDQTHYQIFDTAIV